MRITYLSCLVLFSLLVPLNINAGALVLTPTRLLLVIAFVICTPKLLVGKKSIVDFLLLIHVVWVPLVLLFHHGPAKMAEAGGIYAVEVFGAYALARTSIKTLFDLKLILRTVVLTVLLMLAPAIVESVTGKNIFGILVGGSPYSGDMRMGLHRVRGPFNHSIHYGCYCAIAFGLYQALRYAGGYNAFGLRSLFVSGLMVISTFFGLTTGGLLALNCEFFLFAWQRYIGVPNKWRKLCVYAFFGYLILDLLSDRPAYVAIISRLTFNTASMYYRVNINKFGMENVWQNPLMGLGQNEWVRPDWMLSSTMDNFWLFNAVHFGIPGFLSLFLASIITLLLKPTTTDEMELNVLTGVRIAVFGLVFAAMTVHLWSLVLIFFTFLLGMVESVRTFGAVEQSDGEFELP